VKKVTWYAAINTPFIVALIPGWCVDVYAGNKAATFMYEL